MSYSRWRDDAFWPLFRDEMLKTHAALTPDMLEKAREYNFQRYFYQGVGRYAPGDVYARGLADLGALAEMTPDRGFLFGPTPTSADAGLYGFIANIHFFKIDTPLKLFVDARKNLRPPLRGDALEGDGALISNAGRRSSVRAPSPASVELRPR